MSALALLCWASAMAQPARTQYGEYGIGFSTLNLSSDLSGSGKLDATFQEMRAQVTIFGKYHFNDWFGAGAEMSYGTLYAADANHGMAERGFSVNTELFHSNAFAEIHLIRFGKYHRDRKFSLFLKGGVGIAGWNPELNIPGEVPDNVEVDDGGDWGVNLFGGGGAKFRIAYKSVLTLETRFFAPGGDTFDGLLFTDDSGLEGNDRFWGVMLSYSLLLF